ncbi:MAG: UxaA family hydrolase [Conexivisphaerales archaeon]
MSQSYNTSPPSVTKRYLILNKDEDNVALALEELMPGDLIQFDQSSSNIQVKQHIEFGHKFAIREIRRGDYIVKDGEIIGQATSDISPGEHVHIHNVQSLRASMLKNIRT